MHAHFFSQFLYWFQFDIGWTESLLAAYVNRWIDHPFYGLKLYVFFLSIIFRLYMYAISFMRLLFFSICLIFAYYLEFVDLTLTY